MNLTILVLGFIFGAILQYARLNRFNVISGLATLENYTVAKAILAAVGVGIVLLSLEIGFGYASYHIKPFFLGGIVLGGLIFGMGMAILGYCPGTLPVSLGEGSVDALIGIIGGLVGGLAFTLVLPYIKSFLGPDLGKISLNSIIGSTNFLFYLISFFMGAGFLWLAFWLNKKDGGIGYKWLYAGIALAFLEVIVFSSAVTNRPVGASTAYPYVADLLTGVTQNEYFTKIQKSGSWTLIFIGGAFLSGLVISLLKKEFKVTLIHSNWKKYKGNSSLKRIIWSFVGGFILIFGARMAGGCTSGHIISGGMQLSLSSLVFGIFVFAGLLLTGKFFYKKN